MRPEIVDELVRSLATSPEVQRVWLFGSRARGDAGPRSDIDLAIDAPGAAHRQRLDWVSLIEDADTLLSVDVVFWDEASPALRARILHEGHLLYDGSQARRQPRQPRERAHAAV